MSGHSTYQPQNAFMKWMERRLPIAGLIHSSFVVYPTPRNLNYWWTFGGILSFLLGAQIITGVVLAMHYTPHVDHAFESVERIMREQGWEGARYGSKHKTTVADERSLSRFLCKSEVI